MSELIHTGDNLSPPGDAQQRLKLWKSGHKAALSQGAHLRDVHWNEETGRWEIEFGQYLVTETSFDPVYISDPLISVDELATDLATGLKEVREPFKGKYWSGDAENDRP